MDTSSPGEDVHKVVQIEVFLEGSFKNLDSDDYQFPTFHANCFTNAAVPHIVVVVHVEIENKLSLFSFSR